MYLEFFRLYELEIGNIEKRNKIHKGLNIILHKFKNNNLNDISYIKDFWPQPVIIFDGYKKSIYTL